MDALSHADQRRWGDFHQRHDGGQLYSCGLAYTTHDNKTSSGKFADVTEAKVTSGTLILCHVYFLIGWHLFVIVCAGVCVYLPLPGMARSS